MVWSFTERDILHGLRERGLPVDTLDDLTAREIDLIHQYSSMVFDTAAREFFDVLAARIRAERGWEQ